MIEKMPEDSFTFKVKAFMMRCVDFSQDEYIRRTVSSFMNDVNYNKLTEETLEKHNKALLEYVQKKYSDIGVDTIDGYIHPSQKKKP